MPSEPDPFAEIRRKADDFARRAYADVFASIKRLWKLPEQPEPDTTAPPTPGKEESGSC
jgi:hypothetical protein